MQVGDLAVIDISATTIDEDGSTGEAIPDAESKGFRTVIFQQSHIFYSIETTLSCFVNEMLRCVVMCTGFHFDTEEGNRLLPGFLDSILGIRAGESKSFSLVFPESWKQENLRGQRAQFTVSSFCVYKT